MDQVHVTSSSYSLKVAAFIFTGESGVLVIFKYSVRSEGRICTPPSEKIIPRHVEDYVFIWDYRW